MELATNQFTKGLLMDTHPMVLGNDSLTDCLNGTLITMNGNEVILLNDMGNRRVDNAFLPSGYQPVGMKEYGGIIYVAAYNPITGKSLIGSFPSPLRKIDNISNSELGHTLDIDLLLSEFFVEDGIHYIKSDSVLLPLTDDTSLHAGDKFAIYANNLSSLKTLLTNYDNTDSGLSTTKALSPKNKRYTLQIGILNSLNEFVDITKTLCRWKNERDTWTPINYDGSYSDIFKFNDSYFISDEFVNEGFGETINDAELIKKRQKMATNTYSYKLVGPMYLKLMLNHIENFNYGIYGTYDSGKANLQIETEITYNCPDKAINTINRGNENYISFLEGRPLFTAFDLILNLIVKNSESNDIYTSVYNPNTNTYTTKIVKKYTDISPNRGDILDYTLGVLADSETSNLYIKSLSVEDSIDLSLLGSGKVGIKGWKFYNNLEDKDNPYTLLKLSLNAYPEYGKRFANLRIWFRDIKSGSNEFFSYPDRNSAREGFPVYNGRLTLELNWEAAGLYSNKIYEVYLSYDIVDADTGEFYDEVDLEENGLNRWILTTELFNDFYNDSNIDDYCKVVITPGQTGYNKEFADKMKVSLYIDDTITNTFRIENQEESYGSFTADSPSLTGNTNIEKGIKHTYDTLLQGNPKLKIKDKELYPDFVKPLDNASNSLYLANTLSSLKIKINGETVSGNDVNTIFKRNLTEIVGESYNITDDDVIMMINHIKGEHLKFDINFSYFDKYLGKATEQFSGTTRVFCPIWKLGNTLSGWMENKYGGIVVDKDQENGPDDHHYIYGFYGYGLSNPQVPAETAALNAAHKETLVHTRWDFKPYPYTFNKYQYSIMLKDYNERINKYYNALANIYQMFLYTRMPEAGDRTYGKINTSRNDTCRGNEAARVWWRSHDGTWVLLNSLFCPTNSDGLAGSDSSNGNFGGPRVSDTVTIGGSRSGESNSSNTLEEESSGNSQDDLGTDSTTPSSSFETYLKNVFNREYVYCFYDDYNGQLLGCYRAVGNYKYYDKYSVPISFSLKYSLSNNNITGDWSGIGNLNFIKDDVNLESNSEIIITLKSNPYFITLVLLFINTTDYTIELSTGNTTDYLGNILDRNTIYYILDGELYKVPEAEANNFIVSDNKISVNNNSLNVLYIRSGNKDTPTYRYDSIWGSSDGTTHIDYSLIDMASKDICK